MNKEAHQLKDFLGPGGPKNTRERETILKELKVLKGHFNAEKLYSVLNRKGRKVSRPTIYRTLKLLHRYHLIEKLDVKQNCFYYEPLLHKGDHGHLICEKCGKILDFSIGDLGRLKSTMVKDKGFRLRDISIRIFGLCESCQRVSKRSRVET
jgi:Fur family ferric uptake transcriptional regulator